MDLEVKLKGRLQKIRTEYFFDKIKKDTDSTKTLWNYINDTGLKNEQK